MTQSEVQLIPRTFEQVGIVVPVGSSGKLVMPCPRCSRERKKSHVKCLTVWIEAGTWSCAHCGWDGRLFLHSDGTTNRLDDVAEHSLRRTSSGRKSRIKQDVPQVSVESNPESPPLRTIPQGEVDSVNRFMPAGILANLECTAEEERAAILEIEGLPRAKAMVEAGLGIRPLLTTNMQSEFNQIQPLNPFCAWLIARTRPTVLDDWCIAPQLDRGVIFWYVDIHGRYRTAKKFFFDADGHKIQKPFSLYKVADGFHACLFGEHQLMPGFVARDGTRYDQHTPVILVESEKTVVLASHWYPKFIWLGTSGANGLTASKARVLKGRDVTVWYDCDDAGKEHTPKAAHRLLEAGANEVKTIDPLKVWPGKSNGYDVADFITEKMGVSHE
jgi:hypothetical protein